MATQAIATRRHPAHSKRIDWTDQTDVDAVTLIALGVSYRAISRWTKLTMGQISYRSAKASMSVKDYRQMRPNTVGGKIAESLMEGKRHQVQQSLAKELPARRRVRSHECVPAMMPV